MVAAAPSTEELIHKNKQVQGITEEIQNIAQGSKKE
jgi:hypothetical protein